MELIAAVYDNWGLGRDGTQPVALSADRKFFRSITKGHTVICGRKTMEDFPGKKPLPARTNILITRSHDKFPGFVVCSSPEMAVKIAGEDAMVIGGGSIYRQLLSCCDGAYITKVHIHEPCDTHMDNLDEDPRWELAETIQSGEENGISFDICYYKRK